MSHTLTRTIRTLTFFAGSVLLIVACGGGGEKSSSDRQRNSVLCYEDQAQKDAAVGDARAAFDAAIGSDPQEPGTTVTPVDSQSTTVPADESSGTTVPNVTTTSNTPVATPESTTTLPQSENLMPLTDAQQTATDNLQLAEDQPLCESVDTPVSENASVEHICAYEIFTENDVPTAEPISDESRDSTIDTIDATSIDENNLSTFTFSIGEYVVQTLSVDFNDADSAFQTITYYDPSEESSDTPSPDGQAIVCTGRVAGSAQDFANIITTTDCPDGEFSLRSPSEWVLELMNEGPTRTLDSGPFDLSDLTPESFIVIQITYSLFSEDEVSSEPDCRFELRVSRIFWSCNTEIIVLVNAMSLDGTSVKYEMYCSSTNIDEAAEHGYPEWDHYTITIGTTRDSPQTSFSYHPEAGKREEILIDIPDNAEIGHCHQDPGDYSNLGYSTSFTGASRFYVLRLAEPTNVVITANSFQSDCGNPPNDPIILIFNGSEPWSIPDIEVERFQQSFDNFENCGAEFFDGELDAGEFLIWVGNLAFNGGYVEDAMVTVNSNIELTQYVWLQTSLPETQFETSFNSPSREFLFSLSESTAVTFTVSTNQSCSPNDFFIPNDSFATPVSDLYTADDFRTGGSPIVSFTPRFGSPTNCAVNIIQETLEPGDYVLDVSNYDGDGATITIGSSMVLGIPENISFESMTTLQVDDLQSFDFQVPSGGLWFRAEGNTWNSECSDRCVNPMLSIGQIETVVASSDDEGATADNIYASLIEIFLPEGNYNLLAGVLESFADNFYENRTEFELRYGFGSTTSDPAPEVVLEPSSNNEMTPILPQFVNLPTSGLTSDGSSEFLTAIESGVRSMVCDAGCIDTLFATAGIDDGTIDITVGAQTVTVTKGQRMIMVPVGHRVREISAVVTSSDGSKVVKLSTGAKIISAEYQKALDAKTTFGVNESAPSASDAASENGSSGSSKLPYVLVLVIALLGAAAVVNARRKKLTI